MVVSRTGAEKPLRIVVNAINDNAEPRGPDRYLFELLRHMLLSDPDLTVVLAYAPWQRLFAETEFGPRVERVALKPPRSPLPRAIWQATRFAAFADCQRADTVFLPNLVWAAGLRTPSVVVAHDLLHFRVPEKFGHVKSRLLRFLIRRAVRQADRVIVVSEFTRQDAMRFLGVGPERLVTIHEGGPKPVDRGSTQPEPFFLWVGKVERSKGVDDLVAAFQSSAPLEALGMTLEIVGPDGNASADLGRQLGPDPGRVRRRGFVDEETLEILYRKCRGFVFPSRAEGFGLVVLEAMARGAPVITVEATSLPEVAGDAAILVPPGDVAALRRAMERLAADDALFTRLQAKGYDRLKRFSWTKAALETHAVLRSVAR